MERYVILNRVGSGTYGTIYTVRSKSSDKIYVLKQLITAGLTQTELSRVQQEVCLMQSLRHPFLVEYIDSFIHDDSLCIVMEYCEEGDLSNKLPTLNERGESVGERRAFRWFVQILSAVHFLHSNKILHRDIKTQNLFLTKNNTVKVGDLGIAKVLERTHSVATTHIGTPLYMSPESCQGQGHSMKSDVWALGCVFYELLAGTPPFNARDLPALLVKILKGAYPALPKATDSKFVGLIQSALSVQTFRRPSVEEILQLPFVTREATGMLADFGLMSDETIAEQFKSLGIKLESKVPKPLSARGAGPAAVNKKAVRQQLSKIQSDLQLRHKHQMALERIRGGKEVPAPALFKGFTPRGRAQSAPRNKTPPMAFAVEGEAVRMQRRDSKVDVPGSVISHNEPHLDTKKADGALSSRKEGPRRAGGKAPIERITEAELEKSIADLTVTIGQRYCALEHLRTDIVNTNLDDEQLLHELSQLDEVPLVENDLEVESVDEEDMAFHTPATPAIDRIPQQKKIDTREWADTALPPAPWPAVLVRARTPAQRLALLVDYVVGAIGQEQYGRLKEAVIVKGPQCGQGLKQWDECTAHVIEIVFLETLISNIHSMKALQES